MALAPRQAQDEDGGGGASTSILILSLSKDEGTSAAGSLTDVPPPQD
jgi:hypothetical protein